MKKKLFIFFIICLIVVFSIILIVMKDYFQNSKLETLENDEIKILENNRELVWSGAFQLAWNELTQTYGNSVEFEEDIPFVKQLNSKMFTKEMLSIDDYYIVVGGTNFDLKDKIKEDIKDKFGRNEKSIINIMDFSNDKGITIYSTLSKKFEFINKFDKLSNSKFGNNKEKVKYFGINNESDESLNENIEVICFDYLAEDYAVRLKTKSNEEVILYKGDTNKSFETLYDEIIKAEENFEGNIEFSEYDQIMIPYINLNAIIKYTELCDKIIVGTEGHFIKNAVENVNFVLNETGVNLRSETLIQDTMMSSYKDTRYFLFDDKFVLFLKEKECEKPYFAIKINDTEFLEKDI